MIVPATTIGNENRQTCENHYGAERRLRYKLVDGTKTITLWTSLNRAAEIKVNLGGDYSDGTMIFGEPALFTLTEDIADEKTARTSLWLDTDMASSKIPLQDESAARACWTLPYGAATDNDVPPSPFLFGYRKDLADLYYAGARFYSAELARFTTTDPIPPDIMGERFTGPIFAMRKRPSKSP